jgi:hypothetical protein
VVSDKGGYRVGSVAISAKEFKRSTCYSESHSNCRQEVREHGLG